MPRIPDELGSFPSSSTKANNPAARKIISSLCALLFCLTITFVFRIPGISRGHSIGLDSAKQFPKLAANGVRLLRHIVVASDCHRRRCFWRTAARAALESRLIAARRANSSSWFLGPMLQSAGC